MGMNQDHTVEELLAEIADSAAREADLRNRAEVAEAKLAQVYKEGYNDGHLDSAGGFIYSDTREHPYGEVGDENVNPKVYKVEDGHPWKESQWPSLREAGQCDLCTAPEHLHMQVQP